MTGHSHTMRDEIARSHAFASHWIVHLEFGKVLPHGLVPIKLALIVKHSHGKRGKGLGDGANGKDRPACDWKIAFDVPQAEPMRIDHPAVLYEYNCQTRHFPISHLRRDELFQIIELG